MTPFEDTVISLLGDGALTLDALGGLNSIPPEAAASQAFPEVVGLLVANWEAFDDTDRLTATTLIVEAVNSVSTAAALVSTCACVVPEAEVMGVVAQVKDGLRRKVEARTDPPSAAFAATALRWLTHLAIIADSPKHALHDVLGSVTDRETPEFSTAAARAATVAYDYWHDDAAYDCLDRLKNSDASDDAWFGLGQAAIRKALDEEDRDGIIRLLREALLPFERSSSDGEQQADAALYIDLIRFVTGWAVGAPATQLSDIRAEAAAHLNEFMLGGLGLAEDPEWLRPRYAVESSWLDLLDQMDATLAASDDAAWMEPVPLMSGLVDLFRAANAFTVERTNPTGASTTVVELIAPSIAAPFIRDRHRLALIARWANESGDADGTALRELIEQQVARSATPGKDRPPGPSRR